MNITDIEQLSIDQVLRNKENGQDCKIVSIIKKGDTGRLGGIVLESVVELSETKDLRFYDLLAECTKCGGLSMLRITPTDADKFKCSHSIVIGEETYTCGNKKFAEIERKHLGINCKNNYLFNKDFMAQFEIKEDENKLA